MTDLIFDVAERRIKELEILALDIATSRAEALDRISELESALVDLTLAMSTIIADREATIAELRAQSRADLVDALLGGW